MFDAAYDQHMNAAKIRKQRGLSQAALADLVNVEQPTISRLEAGHDGVTLRLLRQIAEVLEVSVVDLLDDERSEAELTILQAYRHMSSERKQGWNDLARTILSPLQ